MLTSKQKSIASCATKVSRAEQLTEQWQKMSSSVINASISNVANHSGVGKQGKLIARKNVFIKQKLRLFFIRPVRFPLFKIRLRFVLS